MNYFHTMVTDNDMYLNGADEIIPIQFCLQLIKHIKPQIKSYFKMMVQLYQNYTQTDIY